MHGLLLHHCYTNDKQLYFFISEWMASNRLKLNPSKSEFQWYTTLRRRRLLDYSYTYTFALGDTEVRPADTLVSTLTAVWLWRLMWVNSFEAVSTNCVGLKPSANSILPQPPSSWSTASLSPGLTTATACWWVYRRIITEWNNLPDHVKNASFLEIL